MPTSSATLLTAVPGDGPERDLGRGVASMATRLAELLASRFAEAEGVIAQAVAFLRQTATHMPADGLRESPLGRLIDAYALTADDVDLLLLAGLADEHEGFADIFRTLNPRSQPRPTAGLAAQLWEMAGRERAELRALLSQGTVIRSAAVRLDGDLPLFERELVPAPGLWDRLHGVETAAPVGTVDGAELMRAGLENWLAEPEQVAATHALAAGGALTLLVSAEDARMAHRRAALLVELAGLEPWRLLLPADAAAGRLPAVLLHAAAAGRVPVLRLSPAEGPGRVSLQLPDELGIPVVVCVRTGDEPAPGERLLMRLGVERASALSLAQMWRALLPEQAEAAAELAARYPLEPDQALRVVQDLRRAGDQPLDLSAVAEGVRARNLVRQGGGVQLIRPHAGWDDLVLPDGPREQLLEAVLRLRHQALVLDQWGMLAGRRGARGVRLLLSGPSGTGKTLSAEVLASALEVDLLLVDLSRLVSKWIGETEKNLAEVFETAEQSRAVLLFDEADALFGSRTQVSDAHDRYANLETAFLLSRLERFDGLVALSTNLRQNIDAAFLRRLDFIVEYTEPDRAQRLALWQCHLPDGVPRAPDLNPHELAAHFPMVGGLIRNAALAAAFMAASEGAPVGRRHLLRAIRREYDKVGKAYRDPPGVASIAS